uniref:G-protein coupled receptors family 2 profile 2 domain-containing protein n=1 Tax=Electrophorus electricus TaxID=8005 RepID=A0A4W4E2E4_ELEEL
MAGYVGETHHQGPPCSTAHLTSTTSTPLDMICCSRFHGTHSHPAIVLSLCMAQTVWRYKSFVNRECTGMIVFSHLASMQLAITMSYLAVVGHTLSVVSLVISMFIFSYFKCLSCQRISLHKNMFMSFILNSILMVIWFNIINKKVAHLILYTHCSNYFWMLCEGIYLHTLIIVAMFMGEQHLGWYYLLGWGEDCWIDNTSLLYIVHGPIQVALVVNLFFLMNIVRVLITKLRVTHKTESRVYMKAVRATLILVPLMGIHFILVPLQPEGKLALAIYEFLMHIFTHFQGLLVAFVFCFNNGEVGNKKCQSHEIAQQTAKKVETF